MVNYFVSRKYFYSVYCIIFAILVFLCFSNTKEELFLSVNSRNNVFFDYFFWLVTELGNTITYILVMLISLFMPRRFTFMLLVSLALSSILAQGLKHFVFENHLRPMKYFEGQFQIHHLSISRVLKNHSFPSGHTVSAFTLATVIISFIKSRKFDLVFLLLAFLVAYSRVYLGQHFVEDVVFGSILGVFSGTMTYVIMRKPLTNETPLIKVKR